MSQYDGMSDEDLERQLSNFRQDSVSYIDIRLEIKKREKAELRKRDEEVSYRSWLSIFIALGSLLISVIAFSKASGWFH